MPKHPIEKLDLPDPQFIREDGTKWAFYIYIYIHIIHIYIHVWLFIIIYTVVPVCFTSKLATCEPFSWVLCAAAIFIVMTWTMKKFPQIEAQGPEHPRETGIQTKLQKLNKRKLRKPYLHLFLHSFLFLTGTARNLLPSTVLSWSQEIFLSI